jgi:hypothetical protein
MMNTKMMSPRKRMDMEGSGPVRMAKGGSCGTKKMMAGGMTKGYVKGGKVTRADGCCMKGHTKGKMV